MLRWPNTPGIMGDDPPYLAVGTEVSAKYKGAFCEAKVSKVVHSVKCKVVYKLGLGSGIVTDDQIRGPLRVGSVVEVKHSEKKEYVEATISKIQDCSQYTVVFDDGDITTLRRTALCLKSGRHFAESETLDQLPLTHPEHFGNPVVGGRRGGRRSRNAGSNESSDEEESPQKGSKSGSRDEREADTGKVVCVELGDKKKAKDNWFPGLVVSPTAQEVVRIRVKDEYLVRSFKDGRYFTVPKKEVTEFTREIGAKVDNNSLKTAVEKALLYMDRNELPPHWDRDLIFGLGESALSSADSDAGNSDSDSSDDEPREEKDHFVAQLYKFMDDRGTPINRGPVIATRDVDLYKLFKVVHKLGGYNRVTNHNQWKMVSHKLGFGQLPNTSTLVKYAYKSFLQKFEEFYRKLGCTMVNHPRGNRARHRGSGGRNLIRDRDRATPTNTPTNTPRSDKEKGDQGDDDGDGDPIENREDAPEEKEKEKDDESSRRDRKSAAKAKEGEDERPQRGSSREGKREVKTTGSSGVGSGAVPLDVATPKSKMAKKAESRRVRTAHKSKTLEDDADDDSVDDGDDGDDDDSEKGDKATNTRSKSKEDVSRTKKEATPVELRNRPESEKKVNRPSVKGEAKSETGDRERDPAKRTQRPSLAMASDRKTVRSLAAEFEKKAARPGTSDSDKNRTTGDEKKSKGEKRTVKTPASLTTDNDKGDKKIRSVLPVEPERKKVRPSLTANPEKKKVDADKRDTDQRSAGDCSGDSAEVDRKMKSKRKKESEDSETLNVLASYKNVAVGDKLKVYYGPTHEHKVTYEAKVLEIRGEGQDASYLVHYTGWNTRYDEWIKRVRIADNLSWNPARAKRRHQGSSQLTSASASGKKVLTKRALGTKQSASRDSSSPQSVAQSSSQPPRSTTPSSVTSSSSRTKSPATRPGSARLAPAARQADPNAQMESSKRRRTRRLSGPLDISALSESESEQYESESEAETTLPQTKKSGKKASGDNDDSATSKKRAPRKMEVDDDEEEEDDEEDHENDDKAKRPRRTPRLHAGAEPIPKVEAEAVKVEPEPEPKSEPEVKPKIEPGEADTAETQEAPRGRDFDLNQIRSELKGIDRTVKPQNVATSATVAATVAATATAPTASAQDKVEKTEKSQAALKSASNVQAEQEMDDIYEFKEPEPFEFEVRGKRDSPVDSNKIGKRPLSMSSPSHKIEPWTVDSPESKGEKAAPPKKRPLPTPPKNQESDCASDEGSPSRKRFRRILGRPRESEDMDDKVEGKQAPAKAVSAKLTPSLKSDQSEPAPEVMSPQKRLLSSVEEQFKLWQMPNYQSIRTGASASASAGSSTMSTSSAPVSGNSGPPVLTPTSTSALTPIVTSPAALFESVKVLATSGPLATSAQSAKTVTPVLSPTADKIVPGAGDSPSRSSLPSLESIRERAEPTATSSVDKSPKREQTTPEPPQLLPIFGGSPKAAPGTPDKGDEMPSIKHQNDDGDQDDDDDEDDDEDDDDDDVRISGDVTEEEATADMDEDSGESSSKSADQSGRWYVEVRRRNAPLRRKKDVISKVGDESDSDSSTGSRRLVIDRSESSRLSESVSEESATYSDAPKDELPDDGESRADQYSPSADFVSDTRYFDRRVRREERAERQETRRAAREGKSGEPATQSGKTEPVAATPPPPTPAKPSAKILTKSQPKPPSKPSAKPPVKSPMMNPTSSIPPPLVKTPSHDPPPNLSPNHPPSNPVLSNPHPSNPSSSETCPSKTSQCNSPPSDNVPSNTPPSNMPPCNTPQSNITQPNPTQSNPLPSNPLPSKPPPSKPPPSNPASSKPPPSNPPQANPIPAKPLLCNSPPSNPPPENPPPSNPLPSVAAPATVPATSAAMSILSPADDDTGEEGDQDSSLRSLLCEETIPGSPAPPTDPSTDSPVPDKSARAPASERESERERVVEMPFASAPNSSASSCPLVQLREEAGGGDFQTNNSPAMGSGLGAGVGAGQGGGAGAASPNNPPANNIMDNSPPTTPDSSLSTLSTSPREERAESPPLMKENKGSPANDSRVSIMTEEDTSRPTRRPGNVASKNVEREREPLSERPRDTPISRRETAVGRREIPVRQTSSRHFDRRCDDDADLDRTDDRDDSQVVPKKRRRSIKVSESDDRNAPPAKRSRVTMGRQVKSTGVVAGAGAGSDSDENIDPDCGGPVNVCLPSASADSRSSSRPSKYNFYVELPPELDSTERIALIMQKIQELRKTYTAVKSELAGIDRRRKKLRRRDREEKAASKEACS